MAASRSIAIVLFLATGCVPSSIDLGGVNRAPAGMRIVISGIRDTERGLEIDVELRNDSTEDLAYLAHSASEPVRTFQYLSEAGWIQPAFFVCGTGEQRFVIPPGERTTATARVYETNRLRRIRIGIEDIDRRYVVWSPVIDLATRKWGPDPITSAKAR